MIVTTTIIAVAVSVSVTAAGSTSLYHSKMFKGPRRHAAIVAGLFNFNNSKLFKGKKSSMPSEATAPSQLITEEEDSEEEGSFESYVSPFIRDSTVQSPHPQLSLLELDFYRERWGVIYNPETGHFDQAPLGTTSIDFYSPSTLTSIPSSSHKRSPSTDSTSSRSSFSSSTTSSFTASSMPSTPTGSLGRRLGLSYFLSFSPSRSKLESSS